MQYDAKKKDSVCRNKLIHSNRINQVWPNSSAEPKLQLVTIPLIILFKGFLKPDLTVACLSPSSNVCHVLCTITRVNLRIHITQYIGRNIHYYYPENLPCKKSLCAVCVRMISYYPEIILTFIPTYFLAIFSRLLDTRFGSFGIRGENKGYPLNVF